MSKFTKDDVVVGATITVRATYISDRYTDVTTYQPLLVHHIFSLETAFAADGGSVPIASKHPRYTVEILDVQPPKPEYVVGGIYPITDSFGTVFSANRVEHGFGTIGGTWTDEWLSTNGWTVGGRVLVIDRPNEAHVAELLSEHDDYYMDGSAESVVQAALRAEARS